MCAFRISMDNEIGFKLNEPTLEPSAGVPKIKLRVIIDVEMDNYMYQ